MKLGMKTKKEKENERFLLFWGKHETTETKWIQVKRQRKWQKKENKYINEKGRGGEEKQQERLVMSTLFCRLFC